MAYQLSLVRTEIVGGVAKALDELMSRRTNELLAEQKRTYGRDHDTEAVLGAIAAAAGARRLSYEVLVTRC